MHGQQPVSQPKPRLKPHFAPPFEPLVDRQTAITVPLAGFRQARNYSCGFASALMVLRSFGRVVDAEELFVSLGTSRSGTRQAAIVRELRRRQMSANVRYDFGFDQFARAVDRGKLVIGYLADAEHWLVLFGYERDPHRIFVADPRPDEDVEHLWSEYGDRLGKFGIVCSPRLTRHRQAPSQSTMLVPDSEKTHPQRTNTARRRRRSSKIVLPPREQLVLPHCK